jgi:3-mercaptopyruvate sulfurtransferase SseA
MVWSENAVIIDARPEFDYSMNRVGESAHVRWMDYVEPQCGTGKVLNSDLQFLASRMALKGVHPDLPVLVIGKGLGGRGEEAWMAWVLYYLGINDIHFLPIGQVRRGIRANEHYSLGAIVRNAENWQPNVRKKIRVSANELSQLIKKAKKQTIWILDVRPAADYNRTREFSMWPVRTLNIERSDFFNRKGEVIVGRREDMLGLGVGLKDRIIVLSPNGIESAGVTMALLSLGFTEAANLDGGFETWTACQALERSN